MRDKLTPSKTYVIAVDETEKKKLFRALTTKVLSHEELLKVGSYGNTLNIYDAVAYKPEDKSLE